MNKIWSTPTIEELDFLTTAGGGGHGGDESQAVTGCWGEKGQLFRDYWEKVASMHGNEQSVNITYGEAVALARKEAPDSYVFS